MACREGGWLRACPHPPLHLSRGAKDATCRFSPPYLHLLMSPEIHAFGLASEPLICHSRAPTSSHVPRFNGVDKGQLFCNITSTYLGLSGVTSWGKKGGLNLTLRPVPSASEGLSLSCLVANFPPSVFRKCACAYPAILCSTPWRRSSFVKKCGACDHHTRSKNWRLQSLCSSARKRGAPALIPPGEACPKMHD